MYTPHVATLYKMTEAASGAVTIDITFLADVHLQRSQASKPSTRGLAGADRATLFIPFSCKATDGLTQAAKTYADPKTYAAAADKSALFTMTDDGTTYFVLGNHVETGATFQALNKKYADVYKVTGIRTCDYGTQSMRHFEVSGA